MKVDYKNEYGDLSVKEAIAHSLRKTYARIYWEKGRCEGMLTTLVAIIIDKATQEYYYFGIGDSLILKYENDTILFFFIDTNSIYNSLS